MTEIKKLDRVKSLYKSRKEFCDEFGKWPTHYSVRYFLTKLAEIDKALFELGEPAHPMTENIMNTNPIH